MWRKLMTVNNFAFFVHSSSFSRSNGLVLGLSVASFDDGKLFCLPCSFNLIFSQSFFSTEWRMTGIVNQNLCV